MHGQFSIFFLVSNHVFLQHLNMNLMILIYNKAAKSGSENMIISALVCLHFTVRLLFLDLLDVYCRKFPNVENITMRICLKECLTLMIIALNTFILILL